MDLDIPSAELWKYVDDATMSETIGKNQISNIQTAVDSFVIRVTADKFHLNASKCKELRICFSTKNNLTLDPVMINEKPVDIVAGARILSIVSSNLKRNAHIDSIVKKGQKRLYGLSQLKHSGMGTTKSIQFYRTCIQPIAEYTRPVFHNSLAVHLAEELESIQKCAIWIIFPLRPYNKVLHETGLVTLSKRRQTIVNGLLNDMVGNNQSKLHHLLPQCNPQNRNLRHQCTFRPTFKTNRFCDTFITSKALKM